MPGVFVCPVCFIPAASFSDNKRVYPQDMFTMPEKLMPDQTAKHRQTETTIKAIAEIRNQWACGHRRKARKLCCRLLKESPGVPDALHISALMHHQAGN